jgi:hypothetical protein
MGSNSVAARFFLGNSPNISEILNFVVFGGHRNFIFIFRSAINKIVQRSQISPYFDFQTKNNGFIVNLLTLLLKSIKSHKNVKREA